MLNESPYLAPSRLKSRLLKVASDSPILKKNMPKSASRNPEILKKYLFHLPALILGLGGSWLIIWLVTHLSPPKIQDFWIPNSYLPLLVLIWITSFFLSSYILLNKYLGSFLASCLTTLLFFRLQAVVEFWWLALFFLVLILLSQRFHKN